MWTLKELHIQKLWVLEMSVLCISYGVGATRKDSNHNVSKCLVIE